MKNFLLENLDFIISIVTMSVTWILGYLSKKNRFFSNNLIPLQNIIIMLIVVGIYWYITGDFNMVVASSSPIATIIYDAIHSLKINNNEKKE